MSHICVRRLLVTFVLVIAAIESSVLAKPPSEEKLIEMLGSRQHTDVLDALDRLPDLYPHSTRAIPAIKEILLSTAGVNLPKVPANILNRKAARALGDYHAQLGPAELQVIYNFLAAKDVETVLDGLKSLRGLHAPDAVPALLPLLKDENHHIVRDTCRTLAVLGNKDSIPALEPLLQHKRSDVKKDARAAIATLSGKP